MHWAYETAINLINKYPTKNTFTCASGISPSGSVHIGNFREIITTYFVVQALRNLGKNVRFILSWDDFDRFRKVPKNIDISFEQYIGMPYSEIPDPYGCHNSYAEHFEKEFESTLFDFGIDVEYIYQSNEYKSGRYGEDLLHALKNRKMIYDNLMSFKTQEPNEDERTNFYPVTLYCDICRKDNTTITNFDESNALLSYTCSCGNESTVDILDNISLKLNWKIDWPMRWRKENVIFEPGGTDHSAETGSYNVSKIIANKIFNYTAPDYIAYQFIGIKRTNGKMSSSTGNIITPKELSKIYLPEIILFIFAKYHPSSFFDIGLDEDVLRTYTEYERYLNSYYNDTLKDEFISQSLKLSTKGQHQSLPSFSPISSILPLVDFNRSILKEILFSLGETYEDNEIKTIADRAEYWLKKYSKKEILCVNTDKNNIYYEGLNDEIKYWIQEFIKVVQNYHMLPSEQLMKKIYDICHDPDKKVKRNNQKLLFNAIYNLIFSSDSGPRIPILVKSLGFDKIISLIDF